MPARRALFPLATTIPLLLNVLAASPTLAQNDELHPGVRIRITAPGYVADRYDGTILARSGDTLQVARPNGSPVAIPISRMTSIEVSRGRSRLRGAVAGVRWGTAIGAPLGVIAAAAARCPESSRSCEQPTTGDRVAFAALMTWSSALWGAGIGSLVGRDSWSRYTPAGRTSALVEGSGIGVRIGF